ncbi:MAG: hypothetical protein ABR540_06815 [Acidimicrobiales bacterium]
MKSSLVVGVAAAMTAVAGLIHAAAAGTHSGDAALALLFAGAALAQVAVAALLVVHPARRTLLACALLNLGIAAAWGVSRLSGLPLLDDLAQRQPVGLQDLSATVVEVLAAGAAILAAVQPGAALRPRFSPLLALAALPAVVGMAAPHQHDGPPNGSPNEAGHHGVAQALVVDPIFSGAETSHVPAEQLDAAKRLITGTRAAVAENLADEAAVVAAGYRSIGDGRAVGTFEHFVNADYLTDGRELDPEHIESVVFENTGAGKRLASAMYILEWGDTMADVPEIAGDLTTWHDHQNLCWDESGTRLAGILLSGQCFPRGTFRATPPMLHVWLEDHECGPFAGIDGHGGACAGHGHGQ